MWNAEPVSWRRHFTSFVALPHNQRQGEDESPLALLNQKGISKGFKALVATSVWGCLTKNRAGLLPNRAGGEEPRICCCCCHHHLCACSLGIRESWGQYRDWTPAQLKTFLWDKRLKWWESEFCSKVGVFPPLLSSFFFPFFPSPPLFGLAVNGKQNKGLIEQMLDFTYTSHYTGSPVIPIHLRKTYTLHGCFCGMSDIFFRRESILEPSALPTLTIHIITTNPKGSWLK